MERGRDLGRPRDSSREGGRKRSAERGRDRDLEREDYDARRREDIRREEDLRDKLRRDFDRNPGMDRREGDLRRREYDYQRGREQGYERRNGEESYRARGDFRSGPTYRSPIRDRREEFGPSPKGPEIPAKEVMCFKCGEDGHYQASCTNKLICYQCKKPGHVTAGCPELTRKKELQIFGFGIPGQGFYALEVDDTEVKETVKGAGALITIVQGTHSSKILEAELKYWVEENWKWEVQPVSQNEYFVVFPSKSSLRICTRSGDTIELALSKMKITLKESILEPGATAILSSTWVKVFDVPKHAKNDESMKEIAKTFGRPRMIDVPSLTGRGPIRIKVDCRDPKKLRGKIEIFLNSSGFKFRIEAEGVVWDRSDKGKPDDKKPGDDQSDDDKELSDESLGEDWDVEKLENKSKGSTSGSKTTGGDYGRQRMGMPETFVSCFTPHSEPMDKGENDEGVSVQHNVGDQTKLVEEDDGGDSGKGTNTSKLGEKTEEQIDLDNMEVDPKRKTLMGTEDNNMESWNDIQVKEKVLRANITEEISDTDMANATQEDQVFDKGNDILPTDSNSDSDGDDGEESEKDQWIVARHKGSKRSKTVPVRAIRKSPRTVEDGLSVTEKAMKRTAEKNLENAVVEAALGGSCAIGGGLGDRRG